MPDASYGGMLPLIKKIIPRLLTATLCCALLGTGRAVEPEGNPRDTLVYKDGDRVQGHLVDKTDRIIVFESDRFGVLRVLAENAVVIKAEPRDKPAPVTAVDASPAAVAKAKELSAHNAEAEKIPPLDMFRLSALTARLGEFFGPWHGRVALSLEQLSNATDQASLGAEVTLLRKWKSDEVQLKGRYDYNETNDVTTIDLLKAEGLWRHDYPKGWFTLYRPMVEWNRASFNNGVPNDYVQLQQELGVGVSLLSKPRAKVRVGVSENLFDIWTIAPGTTHSARTVESLFLETELKLPWRMTLAQRAVYYPAISSESDGWEDRLELSKKFTETFSTSIRHEIRRFNPDGKTQDYTRLKLLFGLDF